MRVALVEDQPDTREGLAALLSAADGVEVAGAYGSAEEALPALVVAPPDVALFDLGLPGIGGVEGIRRLHAARPEVPVLVLTVHGDDAHVFDALCAGACGYLLKDASPARLVDAVREVAAGGAPMAPDVARRVLAAFRRVAPRAEPHRLSPRELEVLELLAEGHSYKTAAAELGLGIDTVRFHVRHIYEKLHVHSKSEAVREALRRGIVS